MEYGKGIQRLSETISTTKEAASGIPIVELAGDRRVLIENHKGVIEYGNERICVKVQYGCLCICGNKIELAKMTKDQLVITGTIDSVIVRRKGET